MTRMVLCISIASLPDPFRNVAVPGLIPMPDDFLNLQPLWYVPKEKAEQIAVYKQLIPYMVLWDEAHEKIFAYKRGTKQEDQRLQDWSIGIGGHIELADIKLSAEKAWATPWVLSHGYTIDCAARRELNEEVGLKGARIIEFEQLVYDPSTEVGTVHLGLVAHVTASMQEVMSCEKDVITQAGFWDPRDLLHRIDTFEPWSRVLIPACVSRMFAEHSAQNINPDPQ